MHETKDSPALAYKDIMHVGKHRNDPVLVKMVTEKAGSVVDWLIDDLKIPYGPAATQYPDHSASRQLGVEGRSPNFIRTMSRIFTDHGGKILMETRATSLFTKADVLTVSMLSIPTATRSPSMPKKPFWLPAVSVLRPTCFRRH